MKDILIIRFSSLGDVLLTTPVVRSLKNSYPETNIDYLVKREYLDALSHNPYIRNVFPYQEGKSLKEITGTNYDLIIDLQNNIKSNKFTVGHEKKIRFHKSNIKKFLLVKIKLNLLEGMPQIPVRYGLSISRSRYLPKFQLDDKGLDLFYPPVETGLDPMKDYIAIAPGAKHFTKRWPIYHFTRLCSMIIEGGYIPVLVGGNEDVKLCNEIQEAEPRVINKSGENDLFFTASVINECKAAVTCDSGLMHVACAVDTPVVTIFGSSVKEFGFTPYKNNSIVVENNSLNCRPCSHIGKNHCPLKHFKCMIDVQPADVYESLSRLLLEV
ncbi:MAG: glycosyltransferase family 9 protein [Ignavibacteriales bacterium]|jgi:lipopolysaccharide heptosyltransferase II|nr:MAG: glycosyltransferase family 9 protein [Ignavibacteriaceae bacterium]MBW7872750.1 glycosyltransferase family 9 protein [Ignavibacteria bacterium]MCZ2143470.1 glycosyltransferase family 9 protein [Ignavibacteriales bacterium]OQY78109.1 MAG: hypothetical protein B6D45_02430 [Ignavibacteriales bacterium UTCHB3]MBV6444347.1 ADP-heptose--LPS heptosyltransferase 2 [Ignavibacteriaceae bacterium]